MSFKLVCDQRRTEKQGGKVPLNTTDLKLFGVSFNIYAGQMLNLKKEKGQETVSNCHKTS